MKMKQILATVAALVLAVNAWALSDGQLASTLVGAWQGDGQQWSFGSNGSWSVVYVNGVQGRGTWMVRGGVLLTHWVDWTDRDIPEPDNNTQLSFTSRNELNLGGTILHRKLI